MPGKFEGLTGNEAERRLAKFGPNKLPDNPPPSNLKIFLSQLKSPLVYVLLGAAIVTFFLRDFTDTIIIALAVFINTILGFVQESRASQALEALKKLVHPTANVLRDGKRLKIEASLIVPGDIVFLAQGDKIPADGEIVEQAHFFAQEAILTGESAPLEKKNGDKVFMGTIAASGRAVMRVEMTAEKTEIGKIALSVQKAQEVETPLEKQLKKFARGLSFVVLGLTLFVFIVGIFRKVELVELLKTSVALSVSAIPEGLLVALTVVLAIGAQRILKRKGLIRSLFSAETLGGVTTICSDKTGTLTEGQMKVVKLVGDKKELIKQVILTNDFDDPMLMAAWEWAKNNFDGHPEQLVEENPRIDEIPFSSKERFLATMHTSMDTNTIYVNGAPEYLLEWSNLSKQEREDYLKIIKELSKQGMRLIGYAKKPSTKKKIKKDEIVRDLEWVGILAFSDPVRKGIQSALEKTQKAGIRLIVITGDYPDTTLAILRELNILVDNQNVITGEELGKIDAQKLTKMLSTRETMLFARTTPQQKYKLVEALKENGEVVAMTGDGVNDAPALSLADIGIVVGDATDVAKESADLVLLDSSFATIVAAVEEGRGIFDNVRKIVLYLICDAFEEIFLVTATLLMGLPLPIFAAQVLWINLVSDGLPNLALTIDPKGPKVMEDKPRSPKERLVTRWMIFLIVLVSAVGGAMALVVFILFQENLPQARSAAFATLGINSLLYVFSLRALTKPFWTAGFFTNKWLLLAILGGVLLQVAPFVIVPLGNLLKVVPLTLSEWASVLLASLGMFILIELFKIGFRINERNGR